ncbi:hypothetical protein AB0R12_35520, partial [Streptomyces niveus]
PVVGAVRVESGALQQLCPAAERRAHRGQVDRVWQNAMQKLAVEATNADCRKAYDSVKTGW